MISEFENSGAMPVSVKVPKGLPVEELRLHRMEQGGEVFVLVTDRSNALFAVLCNRLSKRLAGVLERADFLGPATQCSALEGMLQCGYAMASYESAAWLTREVRLVLDMRPHVRAMLNEALKDGGAS